jgi:hypothetical protein
MSTKTTKPATVQPVIGLRIPVGSGGSNDPKHNGSRVDRQELASLAGGRR